MQLIIQGDDKRKAKTWLEFAKSKLRQVKAFSPVNAAINRTYKPVSDIFIHIKSINGIDTIRIVTKGGKYMCDFETVERYPIPHSDFEIACPVRPPGGQSYTTLGFLSRTNDTNVGADWDVYAWDFGDGNVDTGVFVSHEYEEPGEYTVSLTVSKDISTYNAPSGDPGSGVGEFQFGQSNFSQDGFTAHEDKAYARYLVFLPWLSGGSYKWQCSAGTSRSYIGMTPTPKKSFDYESLQTSATFDLTGVAEGSTVTCYMQLLLKDWLEHYPNFEDAGFQIGGVGSTVNSDIGGSGTPVIGGQFAPWETFNMGDLSSFIGEVKTVNFTDSAGHVQLPAFSPGIPPLGNMNGYSNVVGISGSDAWAVVEEAGTLLKTTKVVSVYQGRRGHKTTKQIGDSIHT